ncbi:shikimate dehydrogenase [Buchnera aphidicola]|uniref:shikimate dehydrogenase n=1 Tax=Buchnera aphidicola TaxID=9 RepID=UPI002092A900|nr:shikimate dehydrogenase [Buchnera aphidicola]USS94057.1 shikimate dehydrogenase [Buchnera aphidicola (Sipha maydis)]WII23602.1 shikimate dehydrogenase [Buchnera aphidicola (Sipha maydis)]
MNKEFKNSLYAVFGNPIDHSQSPKIHNFFLKKYNFHENYIRVCLEKENFLSDILFFFKNGGKGANITLPFKEKVFSICDSITERARIAGAINTIKKTKKKGLLGDNTDGIGFLSDLIFKKLIKKNFNILLLGAGGAARGVLHPLLNFKCNVYITNRTFSKAEYLSEKFKKFGNIQSVSLNSLHRKNYNLVVNATSTSVLNISPVIPSSLVSKKTIYYDMFYGEKNTSFINFCKKHGAQKVFNGFGMLVNQAAHSFFLWKKIFPNVNDVFYFLKEKQ